MVEAQINGLGGTWGSLAAILAVLAAVVAGSTMLLSSTLRGRARVFLTKTFFRYKYDYRKEWLNFTDSSTSLSSMKTFSLA